MSEGKKSRKSAQSKLVDEDGFAPSPRVDKPKSKKKGVAELEDPQAKKLLSSYAVMMEYKHLQDHPSQGVYVMPSLHSNFRWHGTVFVRSAWYNGGIFKFQIDLPETYPNDPPEVVFVSKVAHPLVCPDTGRVDITCQFPNWQSGKDYVVLVVKFLKQIFYRREYFEADTPPLNAEVQRLFKEDKDQFAKIALECARQSVEEQHNNPKDSLLRLIPWSNEHEIIRSAQQAIMKQYPEEQQKDEFIGWFFNSLVPSLEGKSGKSPRRTSPRKSKKQDSARQ
mmetsp:Transcript_47264/g.102916  ORF Transcript_47264/g.102916 Transcript_47264/m.102916 type:complete len:280 (-) Transcript_47264:10-849(-)